MSKHVGQDGKNQKAQEGHQETPGGAERAIPIEDTDRPGIVPPGPSGRSPAELAHRKFLEGRLRELQEGYQKTAEQDQRLREALNANSIQAAQIRGAILMAEDAIRSMDGVHTEPDPAVSQSHPPNGPALVREPGSDDGVNPL